MVGYKKIMRVTKGVWVGGIVILGIIAALFAVDLRGFRMWEVPFVVFGCAIFAYSLFGWHPS